MTALHRRIVLFACLLLPLAPWGARAQEALMVAAGAGYKRPVAELAGAFERKSGRRVEQFYGNMGQVLAQARQGGRVAVVFGDLAFLEKSTEVAFAGFLPVGEGRLVLAWPKGRELREAAEVADKRFSRIAVADVQHAVYGKAALEYLDSSGLRTAVADRLVMVATVPQVSSYLVTGEVDAGFLNLTEALAIRERIGGYLEIDRKLHSPIRIVGGLVKEFEADAGTKALVAFLGSAEAKAILEKHGL